VYSAPEKGLKAGNTSAISTPVTPASADASAKAKADRRTMSTPMIMMASGFMMAARNALPGRVLNRNSASAIETTTVMASATKRAVET
jgi:hypothetical protein